MAALGAAGLGRDPALEVLELIIPQNLFWLFLRLKTTRRGRKVQSIGQNPARISMYLPSTPDTSPAWIEFLNVRHASQLLEIGRQEQPAVLPPATARYRLLFGSVTAGPAFINPPTRTTRSRPQRAHGERDLFRARVQLCR